MKISAFAEGGERIFASGHVSDTWSTTAVVLRERTTSGTKIHRYLSVVFPPVFYPVTYLRSFLASGRACSFFCCFYLPQPPDFLGVDIRSSAVADRGMMRAGTAKVSLALPGPATRLEKIRHRSCLLALPQLPGTFVCGVPHWLLPSTGAATTQ